MNGIPDNADAERLRVAVGLHQAGRFREADGIYRQILLRSPAHPDALHLCGMALAQDGRSPEAIEFVRRAVAIQPGVADFQNTLGNVASDLKLFDEAIGAYRRALELRPGYAQGYSNLGNALRKKGLLDEAIAEHLRAVQLKPDYAEGHSNLAHSLQERGFIDRAIESYRKAIQLSPDLAEAHVGLTYGLLLRGNFAEGFAEYEWRWRWKDFPSPRREYPRPRWDGSNLKGRRIFVHHEQGMGDAIQFVRYLPILRAMGAEVIAECPAAMARLFSRFAGVAKLVQGGERIPDFDVHCAMMSLPMAMGTRVETIPAQVPYLEADAEIARKWAEQIASSGEYKVGVAWAGHPGHVNDRYRSMAIETFGPVAKVEGVRFISLQKGEGAKRAGKWPGDAKLVDCTGELVDFAETAGLIANLDLVITVDTSVAHLAGAMGKKVWMMLPFSPDWRWMLDRADSPWYPTMRLFRQTELGEWRSVMGEVARALMHATPPTAPG